MTKKLFLLPFALALCIIARGQSLQPQVIASAGNDFSQATAQLNWTVGELMINTYQTTEWMLTQGFQQPNLSVVAIDRTLEGFALTIFPNPTQNELNLQTVQAYSQDLQLSLFDAQGKEVFSTQFRTTDTEKVIDFSSFTAGTYLLRLLDAKTSQQQTFKVTKAN